MGMLEAPLNSNQPTNQPNSDTENRGPDVSDCLHMSSQKVLLIFVSGVRIIALMLLKLEVYTCIIQVASKSFFAEYCRRRAQKLCNSVS